MEIENIKVECPVCGSKEIDVRDRTCCCLTFDGQQAWFLVCNNDHKFDLVFPHIGTDLRKHFYRLP